jgi:phosphoserine phosphatase RsbU/P
MTLLPLGGMVYRNNPMRRLPVSTPASGIIGAAQGTRNLSGYPRRCRRRASFGYKFESAQGSYPARSSFFQTDAGRRMAIVKIVKGQAVQREFALNSAEGRACEWIIGRDVERCHLVLPPRSISRIHARISREGDTFVLRDLGSKAGTILNGGRLKPNIAYELKHRDLIKICDYVLSFFDAEHASDSGSSSGGFVTIGEDELGYASALSSTVVLAEPPTASASAKLAALMQLTHDLRSTVNLDRLLSKILDSLLAMFGAATRGIVMLQEPEPSNQRRILARFRHPGGEDQIVLNRRILDHVMQMRHALAPTSGTMMCVPLLDSEDRPLGVIQLDALPDGGTFGPDDLDLLLTVALQVSVAVENSLLHEAALQAQTLEMELGIAHDIQVKLLPADRPRIEGYEFFDHYAPAKQVGGDYFDYRELDGNRLAILVGDVAGKGVPAALLMAKASTELSVFLSAGNSPVDVVSTVNRRFITRSPNGAFMTLVLAVLDWTGHRISLVNAGHLRPLLRHTDGTVVEMGAEQFGLPLGILPDVQYRQTEFGMQPGEALLLVTDGITEAHFDGDGKLYGTRRLRERYGSASGTAAEIGQWILDDIRRFVGDNPPTDDTCLLCVRRTP